MKNPKDGRLIRQPAVRVKAGELSEIQRTDPFKSALVAFNPNSHSKIGQPPALTIAFCIKKPICFSTLVKSDTVRSKIDGSPEMHPQRVPKYKVILLGDTGVGKTSIAKRQALNTFDFKMVPTLGAAHIRCPMMFGDRPLELMLWDTAGQERFSSLVPMYARDANVCIIVASIVSPDSCDNVLVWRSRLLDSGESPPIVVAINKMDLADGAPVTADQLRTSLSSFDSIYFVSARTGECIEQLFVEVAGLAARNKVNEQTVETPMDVEKNKKEEECGC
jgi:small GTP-binding protein